MLCYACEKLRDIENLRSKDSLLHHVSYTELCRSAERGCELCQAFKSINDQARRKQGLEPLDPRFDEDLPLEKSEISWKPFGHVSLLRFGQPVPRLGKSTETFDRFDLWVDLCTDADDPLATLIPGRTVPPDVSSETCLMIVEQWLASCRNNHPNCWKEQDGPMPSRVIDIGAGSDPGDPKLIITAGLSGAWVALSHCWGSSPPLTTTKQTLEIRQRGIYMTEVPQTFQDAIYLTRRLGFRYLWIDSLCIVQDSLDDWLAESSTMNKVYLGASITISASAAKDGTYGIFNSANQDRHIMKPFANLACRSSSENLKGSIFFRRQIGGSAMTPLHQEPLHSRAWALQESILASRRVDFSSTGLKWSCNSATYSECYPTFSSYDQGRLIQIKTFYSAANAPDSPLAYLNPEMFGKDAAIMRLWYKILSNYCNRDITYHGDRMAAIAGIAREVAASTTYHYRAGIWLEDLHRGLLWQREIGLTLHDPSNAPSWSWASIQSKPPAEDRNLVLHDELMPGSRAAVIAVDVINICDDPYSEVSSASLKIQSAWKSVQWRSQLSPHYNEFSPGLPLLSQFMAKDPVSSNWGEEQGRVICTLDDRPTSNNRNITQGEMNKASEARHKEMVRRGVIYLQIAKFQHQSIVDHRVSNITNTVYALLLEPTADNKEEYRRIGIAEIPENDRMAEGWEVKTVIII